MIIHVYSICWNEEKLLPFFIRHYAEFAEKIVIYDNESSDGSKHIIESSPRCIYRSYSSNNQIRDDLYISIKNNAWKESRGKADWVIVVDVDEFVYTPDDLFAQLRRLKSFGYTIITTKGYNMIADEIPWDSTLQLTALCKTGAFWEAESKPCIFNPNAVREINYQHGAHTCKPKGLWQKYKNKWLRKLIKHPFLLLHYKYLGIDYTINRYEHMKHRLSNFNKSISAGAHYNRDRSDFIKEFENLKASARQIL